MHAAQGMLWSSPLYHGTVHGAFKKLMNAPRVAIVGAGFIGLEVAASCRTRGLHVTVIESLPVPLSPVLGPAFCEMVAAMHRDHGVDLRTGGFASDVLPE